MVRLLPFWVKNRMVKVATLRRQVPPPSAENVAQCVPAVHTSGDGVGGRGPDRGYRAKEPTRQERRSPTGGVPSGVRIRDALDLQDWPMDRP